MKKLLVFVLCSFVAAPVFAAEKTAKSEKPKMAEKRKTSSVGPALLDGMDEKTAQKLETQIRKGVMKHLSATTLPKDFKVKWNEASECISIYVEMGDVTYGVCRVDFNGMQVFGSAAIIFGQQGPAAHIIYADME